MSFQARFFFTIRGFLGFKTLCLNVFLQKKARSIREDGLKFRGLPTFQPSDADRSRKCSNVDKITKS
ncbi:hypothetical protein OCH239_04340 [Roseivivax halodurans JCM 10272]|uniref:Uncharacterized protein n=1 Tax=Roseivivax halodurans JCM 10272 TaxID=1449350 RepID=X7EEN0_9RHOB|nr:hypothetical protein OCH239_04340 [Roseivivax halodurans JCM 10272]